MSDETTTPDGDATTRTGRKPWSTRRKVVLGVAIGLVVSLVAAVGIFAIRLQTSTDDIQVVEDAFPDETLRPAPFEGEGNAPLNYLLLGSDTRAEDEDLLTSLGDRADTILFVHVPVDRESVQVMSIMRDSWVTIPGYGDAKINSALAFGGVPLMVQMVEQLTGQRIDDVAIIDFEGFRGLTDAVGGVTVQNEIAFTAGQAGGRYSYEAGEITLTGDEALDYVRERYAFSDGDYQRVRNQQAYMRGLLDALLQPSVVANPVTLTNLVDVMGPYVATTEGISTSSILGIATQFIGTGVPAVNTFTLPTAGTGMVGSQSVVFVDYADVAVVQQAFQQESMTDFVPPADR